MATRTEGYYCMLLYIIIIYYRILSCATGYHSPLISCACGCLGNSTLSVGVDDHVSIPSRCVSITYVAAGNILCSSRTPCAPCALSAPCALCAPYTPCALTLDQ